MPIDPEDPNDPIFRKLHENFAKKITAALRDEIASDRLKKITVTSLEKVEYELVQLTTVSKLVSERIFNHLSLAEIIQASSLVTKLSEVLSSFTPIHLLASVSSTLILSEKYLAVITELIEIKKAQEKAANKAKGDSKGEGNG